MEALKQIAPNLRRVTAIVNPKTAPYYPLYGRVMEKAASSFAVELIVVEVHDDADIERAISALAREPDGGLFVMPDTFNTAIAEESLRSWTDTVCRQFTISRFLLGTAV